MSRDIDATGGLTREARSHIDASIRQAEAEIRSAPIPLRYAPVRLDDMARVRTAFAEGYKHAPGFTRMPWRLYKQHIVPELDRVLAWPSTELLGAYASSGELCGWLAYSRGRRVDTVHWISVPFWFPLPRAVCLGCKSEPGRSLRHVSPCQLAPDDRVPMRRRGVMTGLLAAAQLQSRLAYTHKGPLHEHRSDGKTMDERLMPWLHGRGYQGLAFVRWEEWCR